MAIEEKAKAAHDIWSHWMKYMFSVCVKNSDGSVIIDPDSVKRWERQMNTDFKDLTEKEQKSDFEIANKYLNK